MVAMVVLLMSAAPASSGFEVTVETVVKGKYVARTHTLTPSRVTVIEHSLNAGPSKTTVDRPLAPAEQKRVGAAVAALPLSKLEKRYVDPKVEAEAHLRFRLRRGKETAEVEVYAYRQPDLWKLAEALNSLLADDDALWYGRAVD